MTPKSIKKRTARGYEPAPRKVRFPPSFFLPSRYRAFNAKPHCQKTYRNFHRRLPAARASTDFFFEKERFCGELTFEISVCLRSSFAWASHILMVIPFTRRPNQIYNAVNNFVTNGSKNTPGINLERPSLACYGNCGQFTIPFTSRPFLKKKICSFLG